MRTLLLALLLALTMAGAPGCALTRNGDLTAQKKAHIIAYDTLASIKAAVEAAMGAYVDWKSEHDVSSATQEKIRKMNDERFVPTFRLAVNAARYDYTAPVPEELAEIAAELLATIHEVSR